MNVRVRVPANMRQLAGGQSVVAQQGERVGQVLFNLVQQYPDLKPRLMTEDGQLQSFVNVFINDNSIRDLEQLDTPVQEGCEILILAALAGG